VDWIRLAKDMVQLRGIVNTVMELRSQKKKMKSENFLTS